MATELMKLIEMIQLLELILYSAMCTALVKQAHDLFE
jgi:hypothetical protein